MTYVLNNMAMVTNEQVGAAVLQIDLHANQSVSVTRQMMQRNALAEVEGSLVKGLPVAAVKLAKQVLETTRMLDLQIQLQIMLQIHTHIGTSSHRPESGA